MAKEKRAVEAQQAIQEMSASLFYAKLRGEATTPVNSTVDTTEKKLSSEKKPLIPQSGDIIVNASRDDSSDSQPSPDFSGSVAKEGEVSADSLTGKDNLDSSNIVSDEDASPALQATREVSYSSPILSFAADLGMATFSMALLLRHLLPPEGGTIRVGALARSLGMSQNNVRFHLDALQSKGIIFSATGGPKGRLIQFLSPLLTEQKSLDFFCTTLNEETKEDDTEKVLLKGVNRYTFTLRLKEFAFACFHLRLDPYAFRPSVLEKWIRISEKKSAEYAFALLLELFSTPKNNPSAYLEKVLENLPEPALTTLERARDFLDVMKRFNDKIGVDVLPKDWAALAGKLGIKVRSLLVNDLVQQQKEFLMKLESFSDRFKSL